MEELPPEGSGSRKIVCIGSPRRGGGVSDALGRETIDNTPEVPDPPNGGLAASDRGGYGLPRSGHQCESLRTRSWVSTHLLLMSGGELPAHSHRSLETYDKRVDQRIIRWTVLDLNQ